MATVDGISIVQRPSQSPSFPNVYFAGADDAAGGAGALSRPTTIDVGRMNRRAWMLGEVFMRRAAMVSIVTITMAIVSAPRAARADEPASPAPLPTDGAARDRAKDTRLKALMVKAEIENDARRHYVMDQIEWSVAVEERRSNRQLAGYFGVGGGLVMGASGAIVLGTSDSADIGGLLIAGGVLSLGLGVWMFLTVPPSATVDPKLNDYIERSATSRPPSVFTF